MIARRYIFKGRVQGVGFRFFVYDAAREMGVQGWVRNRPDGSVEAHCQAGEETLKRFLTRIKGGPPLAVVRSLELRDVAPESLSGFSIRA